MIKLTTTTALDTGALIVVLGFTDPLGTPVPAPELRGTPEWFCDDPSVGLEPMYNGTQCRPHPPAGVGAATITARVQIFSTGSSMEGSLVVKFKPSAPVPNPKPTIGRIIHVRLREQRGELITRPGIIVRTWQGATPADVASYVNAQVFTDESNDGLPPMVWMTSLNYDGTGQLENSWSYPSRA